MAGNSVKQAHCLGAKTTQGVLQALLQYNCWVFDLHLQVKSEYIRHMDTNPGLNNPEEGQTDWFLGKEKGN